MLIAAPAAASIVATTWPLRSIGGLAGVRNPGQWNPTLTKLNRELAAMRGEPPPPDLTGALLSLQRPIR